MTGFRLTGVEHNSAVQKEPQGSPDRIICSDCGGPNPDSWLSLVCQDCHDLIRMGGDGGPHCE
jgi:hypothetical protein